MGEFRFCEHCKGPATHQVYRGGHGQRIIVCGNPVCREPYPAPEYTFMALPPLCSVCEGSGYDPDWTKAGDEGACHACEGMGVEDDRDPCGGL